MSGEEKILNITELNERLDSDMNLFRELTAIFTEDSENLLENIRESIRKQDAPKLAKSAHTIKGAVSNFSAEKAYEKALNLEKIGKSGDLSKSETGLKNLERSISELINKLNELANQNSLL